MRRGDFSLCIRCPQTQILCRAVVQTARACGVTTASVNRCRQAGGGPARFPCMTRELAATGALGGGVPLRRAGPLFADIPPLRDESTPAGEGAAGCNCLPKPVLSGRPHRCGSAAAGQRSNPTAARGGGPATTPVSRAPQKNSALASSLIDATPGLWRPMTYSTYIYTVH